MKKSFIFWCILANCLLAIPVVGQANSVPVLNSTASYSMPQTAIDAEIGGTVVVAISVDDKGTPTRAMLASGPMWPCSTTPVKAFEDLSSTLADTMMKLRFSPAMKDGKPVAADIGLTIQLNNPKLAPKPAEIDPATGKPLVGMVSAGILNGKASSLPIPEYPAAARVSRESGSVGIQVLIDEKGIITRAGGVSGPPTLQIAARTAACSAKFAPTKLQGRPVKISGVLTYNFNL